jgi:DNA-directed RNA polymerase specialized sigma subunit
MQRQPTPPEDAAKNSQKLSLEEANELVVEHQGWAESIARAVARSWNLDWKLDGLDGAALEALLFCARRFQPGRGVPFRGYARKRIHEASTDAARKSKGWRRGMGANSKAEHDAREISAELFNVFPDLRNGELPFSEDGYGDDSGDMRSAARHLLVGASMIAARIGASAGALPDEMLDYKRLVGVVAALEPVHQQLLWQVYWDGNSMRTVASEWEVDELSVIREHKSLLDYLHKRFGDEKPGGTPGRSTIKSGAIKSGVKLKVRPALKVVSIRLRQAGNSGAFSKLLSEGGPVSTTRVAGSEPDSL